MQEETQRRAPVELAQEVWSRRKWLALAVVAVPLAITLSLATFLPSIYRSTVIVMVDRQQLPEAFVRATVTSAVETRLQKMSQEILSRSRLEALVDRFGLYADLKNRMSSAAVAGRMRSDIQLELKPVREGRGIVEFALSYRGREPRQVALVANTLASFYVEQNVKVRELQAADTAEFLKAQLTGVRSRLDGQERLLSEFKKRYPGELPQQLDANLATIERLSNQLRVNWDNQIRAVERREALLRSAADADAPGGTGLDAIEEQLAKLNQTLMQFRARYTDKHPAVVRTQEEIALLEQQLSQRASNPPKSTKPAVVGKSPSAIRTRQALSEVEAEIRILKGEEQRFRSAIAVYLGRVENVPKREQEYRDLSRDYDTTRELYVSLQKRYEEAQLAESMEQRQKGEQFRILDPAVPSQTPMAPDRLRLMLVGAALSLGLAVVAVVGTEQLNTKFHSVDDLRAFTSVPVLVRIPWITTAADTDRQRRRARLVATTSVVGLVAIVGVCYLIAHGNEQLVTLLALGRS